MDRSTKQKRAIEAVLRNHRNPLTAMEILGLALQEVPSIGIATVYRSLKSLANDGQVVSVEIPGEPPRYERADKGSTHYWDELHFARFNLEWLTNGKEISTP